MSLRAWRYVAISMGLSCLLLFSTCLHAQCPPNIGFEQGNFEGWVCSTGTVGPDGTVSVLPGDPTPTRHTIIYKTKPAALDPYGNFPMSCPNGSGYSIQLGNDGTGKQAEQVSYTFTIPANDNNFSLIYNYAVVFQDPDHSPQEQPSFKANVYDVSTGAYIGCSSFNYHASSTLPGFSLSGRGTKVFYKPWTPVTIKLSGYAGRTIRLEFTTNDCTKGGHFGYAYVDVNQNCASPVTGNVQCKGDTSQTLTAPYGFASYRWFNSDFSKVLGTQQNFHTNPPPSVGTKLAVEVTPFPEQGCIDTVYTTIEYSSETINLNTPVAGVASCVANPVDLTANSVTAGSTPNMDLSYYMDPNLTQYLGEPSSITKSGTYYIKAVNAAGCTVVKPITIQVYSYPDYKINLDPPAVRRPATFDMSTILKGDTTGVTYTFWKDSLGTIPLPDPKAITHTGRYFVKATIQGGCFQMYGVNINVDEAIIVPPNAFSPNGDGVNDTWEIPLLKIYGDCVVDIYNRRGQLLFHSVGYAKPWDGTYKGLIQPADAYYYIIKPRADMESVSGSVLVLR